MDAGDKALEDLLRAASTGSLIHQYGESKKRAEGADPKTAALEAWTQKGIVNELARRVGAQYAVLTEA